jgi:hypothetical protein
MPPPAPNSHTLRAVESRVSSPFRMHRAPLAWAGCGEAPRVVHRDHVVRRYKGTSRSLTHGLLNFRASPLLHKVSFLLVYILCALRDHSYHGLLPFLIAERRCGFDFSLVIISAGECCKLILSARHVVLWLDIFQWLGFLDRKPCLLISRTCADQTQDSDPTHGLVQYLSQTDAQSAGLISQASGQPAFMGVDHLTTLSTTAQGRKSVRITTEKAWTHGLFIADIAHMPDSTCGVWPACKWPQDKIYSGRKLIGAVWMFGPNWPSSGEIDIIEGVSRNTQNKMSMHT